MARASVEFYGTQELLQKLEAAGQNVVEACASAMQEGIDIAGNELINAWHGIPRKSRGLKGTLGSYRESVVVDGDKITAKAGFDPKHGGLPALFFQVGYNPGHEGWITDVRDKALDDIRQAELDTLKDLLNVE